MDIIEFLNSNLLDIYGEFIKYNENISDDEYDDSFVTEDNRVLSDLEYILLNYKDIYEDVVFEELYEFISDTGYQKDISLRRFVAFLADIYFVYNYDKNNRVIKFLHSSSLEDIEDLFVENEDFGIDMVKTYFMALVDTNRYKKNREIVEHSDDIKKLNYFESNYRTTDIKTLSDILRNVLCNLYNYYIMNGCDDITALNCTWQYFLSNFDPLGELDQMGYDVQTKDRLKPFMVAIIYSDLYEDICNNSIIQSVQDDDNFTKVFVIMSTTFGLPFIPNDENIRNRMLKYFILLQDEKEKMQENRIKTKKDGRSMVLKKVNPLYILDELT